MDVSFSFNPSSQLVTQRIASSQSRRGKIILIFPILAWLFIVVILGAATPLFLAWLCCKGRTLCPVCGQNNSPCGLSCIYTSRLHQQSGGRPSYNASTCAILLEFDCHRNPIHTGR